MAENNTTVEETSTIETPTEETTEPVEEFPTEDFPAVEETPPTVCVLLDEERYWTGQYALTGSLEGGIEVPALPEETDRTKWTYYKLLDDDTWYFDEEKYNNCMSEQQAKKLSVFKSQKIAQSKKNLEEHLQSTKLVSDCHGGVEKEYSITSEKQQHLASMILTATLAAQSGLEYQPSWNASGEACTNDWTLAELQQLAMEMEEMVRPLVTKQQKMEVAIQESTTLEELEAIDITFGEGVE